jgi:hypothetical protein
MIEQSVERLDQIMKTVPGLLTKIPETEFSYKPELTKWSKKEILGHLIDSATNNHQRFVRGQFEESPAIKYDQNKWNEFSFHQLIDSRQLISFWTIYNKQLLEIINRIPKTNLARQVKVGDNFLTLEFLIVDYVQHLEHHLNQIITDYIK